MLSLVSSSQNLSPFEQADLYRLEIAGKLDPKKRGALGQYTIKLP